MQLSFRRSLALALAASHLFLAPAFDFVPNAVGVSPAFAVTGLRAAAPTAATAENTSAEAETAEDPLAPYRGLATWIDMFDEGPWKNPELAVNKMANNGVATIFIQTSNFRRPNAIFKPKKMDRFLAAAHALEIDVIAWYLPSFDNLEKDLRRSKKAINYTSVAGEVFDGFALDIESTEVRDVDKRNRRMLRLSRRIRDRVGLSYELGAIMPDYRSTYWPGFPYRRVYDLYDVFLPMAYYTHRFADGRAQVKAYVLEQMQKIRTETGDDKVPMHVVGGIAGETTDGEVRGYSKAIIEGGGLGGGLYDFAITQKGEWAELQRLCALAEPQ